METEERISVLFFVTDKNGKVEGLPVVRGADVVWVPDPVLGKLLIKVGKLEVNLIYTYYEAAQQPDGRTVHILPLWDGSYNYDHHNFE